MCSSPGNHGSSSARDRVDVRRRDGRREADLQGRGPARAASSAGSGPAGRPGRRRRRRTSRATPRSPPGSMSGTWWDIPSKSTSSMSRHQPARPPGGPPIERPGQSSQMPRRTDPESSARQPIATVVFTDGVVPRQSRTRAAGPGRWPTGRFASGAEPRDDEPAHGGHGRPRGPPSARSTGRLDGRQRLDLRRQLLPATAGGPAGSGGAGGTARASRSPTRISGSRSSPSASTRPRRCEFKWVKGHSGDR